MENDSISVLIGDRNFGTIQSEKTSFISKYSFEINGKPIDTTAWLVLSHALFSRNVLTPKKVTAEWLFKITPDAGGSSVNVVLNNIEAYSYPPLYGESTGVFEKIISNQLN